MFHFIWSLKLGMTFYFFNFLGVGYNGFPTGCSDDSLPWGKSKSDRAETKYMYVCHAEMNAILNKVRSF
jgi:deoxycytidylate deaminase